MMIPSFKEWYNGTRVVAGWMLRLIVSAACVSGVIWALPVALGCVTYFVEGERFIFDLLDVLQNQQVLSNDVAFLIMSFIIKEKDTILYSLTVGAALATLFFEFLLFVWAYCVYRFCFHYAASQMNHVEEKTENSILPQ